MEPLSWGFRRSEVEGSFEWAVEKEKNTFFCFAVAFSLK
jgi:hypothetical protein